VYCLCTTPYFITLSTILAQQCWAKQFLVSELSPNCRKRNQLLLLTSPGDRCRAS
jgi:hypothetical protein